MRIKQAIIPAILALSAAGSILIGSVAVAVPAASTTVVASANTHMIFHD